MITRTGTITHHGRLNCLWPAVIGGGSIRSAYDRTTEMMGPPTADTATAAARAMARSRWLQGLVGIVVVVAAFAWALPRFASYGEVWDALSRFDGSWTLALVVVGLANLVAPAVVQVAALPGLRTRQAVFTDWITSAVTNVLPGGSAVAIAITWTMYRAYGLTHGPIARSIVVTGVWDTFVKLGTPLLAVVWLATERPVGPGLVQAALVGAALFVVVVVMASVLLTGTRTAIVVGSLLDRLPFLDHGWPERLVSLRADTLSLLRSRWRSLTWWTVAGHANLYVLLVVCLRGIGVDADEASLAAVLAALAFGRLITALPVSPGGVGVMEVGLTGALAAVSTAPEATLVAAVLLFRGLTFLVPIPLGLAAWAWWTLSRQRRAVGLR